MLTLIRREESKGDLHGIKICRRAPIVSHIFFAEDSLLFFSANEREVNVIKKILNDYELACGQAVNLYKSEVFFSNNTSIDMRNNLTSLLGVFANLESVKYLGLPSLIGSNRKSTLTYLKDRV